MFKATIEDNLATNSANNAAEGRTALEEAAALALNTAPELNTAFAPNLLVFLELEESEGSPEAPPALMELLEQPEARAQFLDWLKTELKDEQHSVILRTVIQNALCETIINSEISKVSLVASPDTDKKADLNLDSSLGSQSPPDVAAVLDTLYGQDNLNLSQISQRFPQAAKMVWSALVRIRQ